MHGLTHSFHMLPKSDAHGHPMPPLLDAKLTLILNSVIAPTSVTTMSYSLG